MLAILTSLVILAIVGILITIIIGLGAILWPLYIDIFVIVLVVWLIRRKKK